MLIQDIVQWHLKTFYHIVCIVFVNSADVNPEHHVRILEALIATGGLMEIQAAPGRIIDMHTNVLLSPFTHTILYTESIPFVLFAAFVSALVCNG